MQVYSGSLSSRRLLPPEVRAAMNSYRAQKSRCTNSKDDKFKYYGALGLSVHYSKREFIGWWISEYTKRDWSDPTVGRIDHTAGYFFENIIMQERSENSREARERKPVRVGRSKVPVIVCEADGIEKIYPSVRSAARALNKTDGAIVNICRGLVKKTKEGATIKYASATI